jgi:hypothetical protein
MSWSQLGIMKMINMLVCNNLEVNNMIILNFIDFLCFFFVLSSFSYEL